MGIPSFRLEGPYLALATLGGGEAIRLFIETETFLDLHLVFLIYQHLL